MVRKTFRNILRTAEIGCIIMVVALLSGLVKNYAVEKLRITYVEYMGIFAVIAYICSRLQLLFR